LVVRECDGIAFIVSDGVDLESSNDIAHLRETKILSVELPFVSLVDLFDKTLSLSEYASLGIVEIDFPLDPILMRYDGDTLQDSFSRGIFFLIDRSMRESSERLISSMVEALVISPVDMMPVDRPRAKYKIVELREENVVGRIHVLQKYATG